MNRIFLALTIILSIALTQLPDSAPKRIKLSEAANLRVPSPTGRITAISTVTYDESADAPANLAAATYANPPADPASEVAAERIDRPATRPTTEPSTGPLLDLPAQATQEETSTPNLFSPPLARSRPVSDFSPTRTPRITAESMTESKPIPSTRKSARITSIFASTDQVATTDAPIMQGVITEAPTMQGEATPFETCLNDCSSNGKKCDVEWLKKWTCKDLERKPAEPGKKFCGCGRFKNFFWCVPDDKKDEASEPKEAEGEEKIIAGLGSPAPAATDATDGGRPDEEKKEDDAAESVTPLMQWIKCRNQCAFDGMQKRGDKIYGWLQMGATYNPNSPNDRINFGTNFNNRSNDFQLNQLYLVIENSLEHDKGKFNFGYRVDVLAGTDAPFIVSNGLFDRVVNEDQRGDHIGADLPQFYVEAHIPYLTQKGFDLRIGKFYTLMGGELTPGTSTDFYSHSYESFYGLPFTHTGISMNTHLTDTIDFVNCVVQGWDQFEDVNSRPTYHGGLIWNSCDKRNNISLAWAIGPEQADNNDNLRGAASAYYSHKFGCYDQWKFVCGGHAALEENAAVNAANGNLQDAEWYGAAAYLFYTVDPRLILGSRAEWFRDDDGVRTALGAPFNRPGFAGNFYEVTLNATYKPFQNLRLRPEVRYDWTDGQNGALRPFNDLSDKGQLSVGMDLIWDF